MKRSGLTLLEIVLTVTLLSILFAGLFNLHEARKTSIEGIKANTFAIFAMESLKNRVLFLKESGELNLKNWEALSPGIFTSRNWQLTWAKLEKPEGSFLKFKLADLQSPQKRAFFQEVPY